MGLNLLLMGVIAAIAGGLGNLLGLAIGSLLLALLQHSTAWFLGPEWQDALALALFVAVLHVRPTGLLVTAAQKAKG
jgi:branched-subunit amino acid ABC-type transport system permease component